MKILGTVQPMNRPRGEPFYYYFILFYFIFYSILFNFVFF